HHHKLSHIVVDCSYRIIYCGGKDQKNSYRQALEAKYKSMNGNFKTKLFENGLAEDNVPKEFRFKNSTK
ncbi:hypothetical protein, partial [Mycoplasmopsis bovis]|uniref:hypothetical protein n=1 Tax=Mycoplasmopsis bovis TaxID=28903 RepID=UPI003D2E2565